MTGFAKHIGLLLHWFFSSILLYPQNEFSYRVINENVFTYNLISEDTPVNPTNILELSELETVNRFFPIGTFKRDRLTLQAEPRLFFDPISENIDVAFNELYVRYGISAAFYVTFGKERINWGTGTVWNPSNPFLQKDPFRLDNRLEGVFLTNLEYIFPRLTLNLLFSPSEKVNTSTLALKATVGKMYGRNLFWAVCSIPSSEPYLCWSIATVVTSTLKIVLRTLGLFFQATWNCTTLSVWGGIAFFHKLVILTLTPNTM